jgi:LysM repeat protein
MRKLSSYIATIIVLLASTIALEAQQDKRSSYIAKYKNMAIEQMRIYGVPASITLAQGCLESGNGESALAVNANNHFGIKCHNWNGATFKQNDDKKNECFRKYRDVKDSYKDHSEFLRYRDRYAFLFDLQPTDYKAWAYGLKKAGYATDPQYATTLIKIIEEYKLWEYDQEQTKDKKGREKSLTVPPTPKMIEQPVNKSKARNSHHYPVSLNRSVMSINGVAYIVAQGIETYESIAREFNPFHNEILAYNELTEDVKIEPGTIVYIEAKKRKGAKHLDKHICEAGETMYSLSQRFAIKLKYLYKYNNLQKGYEPEEGAILNLRPIK